MYVPYHSDEISTVKKKKGCIPQEGNRRGRLDAGIINITRSSGHDTPNRQANNDADIFQER
jgi:hypothetical protein